MSECWLAALRQRFPQSLSDVVFIVFFTGESDAAQSGSVVSVYAGHRRLHRRTDRAVIQQQQAAPVRHVHLTQQISADRGAAVRKRRTTRTNIVTTHTHSTFYLDFTRTIPAVSASLKTSGNNKKKEASHPKLQQRHLQEKA